ncbi:MAG: DUF3048 domain-containing protein [Lactobacillales bacterium]|nr:DUF3048 domain-containing protein [Lactobacillales bacterium]
MKKINKILLVLLGMFIITGCGCNKKEEVKKETKKEETKKEEVRVEKKLTIINEESNSRPYAVVINNIGVARKAQTGLQDAQVIYEFLAEGGITRFVAIYKDKDTAQIGTVRSARHNFLDVALEYDAIFVHFGGSDYGYEDIKKLGVNDIDGMTSNSFWRENPYKLASEHTAYTSMAKIKKEATKKYKTTTTTKWPLNYSYNEVNLDGINATNVSVPFSDYTKNSYKYDSENKVYKRYVGNKEHVDMKTKQQFTFKNIIIAKMGWKKTASNYYLDIQDVGSGSGYYITNGKAIEITWSKKDRKSRMIYKDKNGNEIKLNDGNTFVEFQPTNQKTTIK